PRIIALKDRVIEEEAWLLAESPVLAILYCTDDFKSLLSVPVPHSESGANRIAVRPEAARHLFIDDDHLRRAIHIAGGEFAPAQNRRPHRLEIIGADAHRAHSEPALAVRRLMAFNVDCFPRTDGPQRQMACQARRFDSGNCSGSLDQVVEE